MIPHSIDQRVLTSPTNVVDTSNIVRVKFMSGRQQPLLFFVAISCLTLSCCRSDVVAYTCTRVPHKRPVLRMINGGVNSINSQSLSNHPPSYRRNKPLLMEPLDSSHDTPIHQQLPTSPSAELPANLKRRVVAKRPALGHLVPKNSRSRRLQNNLPDTSQKGGSNSALLRPQGESRDTVRYNNPSNLRILGGSNKGRKLESPDVYLRPMMGKVREAVFSTFTTFGLYDDRFGESTCTTRHLDIFSGSGSVGLESLSRGARHCTFVDLSNDCCRTCERNIERCGFDQRNTGDVGLGIAEDSDPYTKVVCADAFRVLNQPETVGIDPSSKYDIITLCPPYEEVVYADLLESIANSELVKEDTIVMIEYPVELGCFPHVIRQGNGGALIGIRNRKYGRTVIAMYIVNPSGSLEAASSRPEEFISL